MIQPVRRAVTALHKGTERQDSFAHYDLARARQALLRSAGALARVDRRELLADLRAQREQTSTGRPA